MFICEGHSDMDGKKQESTRNYGKKERQMTIGAVNTHYSQKKVDEKGKKRL